MTLSPTDACVPLQSENVRNLSCINPSQLYVHTDAGHLEQDLTMRTGASVTGTK